MYDLFHASSLTIIRPKSCLNLFFFLAASNLLEPLDVLFVAQFPNRPPTLEIFPSWPMRYQQITPKVTLILVASLQVLIWVLSSRFDLYFLALGHRVVLSRQIALILDQLRIRRLVKPIRIWSQNLPSARRGQINPLHRGQRWQLMFPG